MLARYMVQCGVVDGLARLGSWINSVYTTLVFLVRSAGIFFNLLGIQTILKQQTCFYESLCVHTSLFALVTIT